jgi:hypothetical protein
MTGRRRCECGAVSALELVLLAPVLLVLLLFVAFCGRVARTDGAVHAAARAAARAASVRAEPAAATADAVAAARAHLAGRSVDCPDPVVDVVADLRPGGRVRVSLRCRMDLAGLGLLGVPGTLELRADTVDVVDRYRSGRP